jgi:tryptophanyl-tRNA synthetase
MGSSSKKVVLSGMRSTGRLHLGHYFGTLKNWVALQEVHRCFFFAADWHALTSEYEQPRDVARYTLEALADWLAVGIDPQKSTVFVQSMVPAHAELHLLFSMITPLGWLERVPTYKEQMRQLEQRNLETYGFLGYPVLQTADILIYRADFVPVGEDQVSHLELAREIARRFNGLYGDVFPEPQALLTPAAKVPGIDGRKMSKSYGNAIYLSDSPDEIVAKCQQMFTDPLRVRRRDPGHPESCNLFEFHCLVSDPSEQEEIAVACRSAALGCVEDKRRIADRLIAFLEPIRRRREQLLSDPKGLLEILETGSKQARERAEETLAQVRRAVGLDYRRLAQLG